MDLNRRARLYSAKSGAPLAVLSYHRSALHALTFTPLSPAMRENDEESDSDEDDINDEIGKKPKGERHWMATGGTEGRITLWDVY